MGDRAPPRRVATHRDGHFAHAEHIEHVELAGLERRAPPSVQGLDFKRTRVYRLLAYAVHAIKPGQHGIKSNMRVSMRSYYGSSHEITSCRQPAQRAEPRIRRAKPAWLPVSVP